MIIAPILKSSAPAAWLINRDEVARFGPNDDFEHSTMRYLYLLGAAILIWRGADGELRFNAEKVSHDSLTAASDVQLYPIDFKDTSGIFGPATATNQAEAEAIRDEILLRRTIMPMETLVVDRPPEAMVTSGDFMKQSLESWNGVGDMLDDLLVQISETPDGFRMTKVGERSAAAEFHGEKWREENTGKLTRPNPPGEDSYADATETGYQRAAETMVPVLQDVYAVFKDEGAPRRQLYRRLLLPRKTESGVIIDVASEMIWPTPVNRKAGE